MTAKIIHLCNRKCNPVTMLPGMSDHYLDCLVWGWNRPTSAVSIDAAITAAVLGDSAPRRPANTPRSATGRAFAATRSLLVSVGPGIVVSILLLTSFVLLLVAAGVLK